MPSVRVPFSGHEALKGYQIHFIYMDKLYENKKDEIGTKQQQIKNGLRLRCSKQKIKLTMFYIAIENLLSKEWLGM